MLRCVVLFVSGWLCGSQRVGGCTALCVLVVALHCVCVVAYVTVFLGEYYTRSLVTESWVVVEVVVCEIVMRADCGL